MTGSEGTTPKVDRRRGPRVSEAEIRAKVEAEVRAQVQAQVEAEMREQVEAEVRAKVAAEQADAERLRVQAEVKAANLQYQTGLDLDTPGAVTAHFVEDGFTLLGKVWMRGEEVTIKPESQEWKRCPKAPDGRLILQLNGDEQTDRWGKRFFKLGPWKGLGFDLTDPTLSAEDRQRLLTIQKERKRRVR